MKPRSFSLLAIVIAATGCLAFSAIVLSQSVEQSLSQEPVDSSTCVTDTQGLMCSPEERDNSFTEPGISTESQVISSTQMDLISNSLLGFLYFVLPVGLGVGIALHDKYSSYRLELLNAQINLLERIWKQTI